MKRIRVGINGFGRIGRQVAKVLLEQYANGVEIVAVNDITDAKTHAYLFLFDTNYGKFNGKVEAKEDMLIIDDHEIRVLKEEKPEKLPWKELGVELVVEATGKFTKAEKAKAHIAAGAKKVLITAPAEGEDVTIVLGVNHSAYDPKEHHILSNASCTTNCLAPVCKVIHEKFGIQYGLMTTVHAYTNDQRVLDLAHPDLRRARAAAMNIIPTRTGAASAIHRVLPDLQGKLHGVALRVPVSTVSVIDLNVVPTKPTNTENLIEAFEEAAQTPWRKGGLGGILRVEYHPCVSSDFKGDPHSAIVDGDPSFTFVGPGGMIKVTAWYDNEWSYACRTADLIAYVAEQWV